MSETSFSRQLIALVLTTKNKENKILYRFKTQKTNIEKRPS